MKTRGIYKRFLVHEITTDKKGNPVEQTTVKIYPVRINSAIPFSHKNFQSCL